MNAELRKEANNNFLKYFFKLINNSVFGKVIEMFKNIKHRYIQLATIEKRTNYLVSESNYHTTKF